MKYFRRSLVAGAVVALCSTAAHAEFSANIGAASNYLWRGVSQTDDGAAISGGLDYAHESGFYLGTWASNIEGDTGGAYELDLYGGFGGEFSDLGYDLGFIYYAYPDDDTDDWDFYELYGSLSWQWISGGLAYTLGGDADDDAPFSDGDIYYWGSLSFDVAEDWTIGATIGHYDFDASGDFDYTHYQGDITKSAGDFGDFTFTVSGADESDIASDDTKVVVSWAKSF
ncbi:MAG: TorF family putative porin [Pseudomonadota bacterium]